MTKLKLNTTLSQLDKKAYSYYNNLTPEEKKSFSGYLLLRYASSVDSSPDMEEYYLRQANEVNKNFFDLSKHPDLQWKLLSTISPNMGNQFHPWLNAKK